VREGQEAPQEAQMKRIVERQPCKEAASCSTVPMQLMNRAKSVSTQINTEN
jgi:hypothetical protein